MQINYLQIQCTTSFKRIVFIDRCDTPNERDSFVYPFNALLKAEHDLLKALFAKFVFLR